MEFQRIREVQRGATGVICSVYLENAGSPVTDKTFEHLDIALFFPEQQQQLSYTLETIQALGLWVAPSGNDYVRIKAYGSSHPGLYQLQFPNWLFSVANRTHFIFTISEDGTPYATALCVFTTPIALTLGPTTVIQASGNLVGTGVPLSMHRATAKSFVLSWLDADGNYVDHSGKDYRFIVGDNQSPPNGKFECENTEITISGTGNRFVTVAVTAVKSDVDLPAGHWWLYDKDTDEIPAHGEFLIQPALTTAS